MSEDAWLLDLLEELVEALKSELESVTTDEDPLELPFWEVQWPSHMKEICAKVDEYKVEEDELLSGQLEQLGVTWHHLDDSPEKDQIEDNNGGAYRETDWIVEVDDVKMWRTLRSSEDWRSRLDLIMSRAIPDWR